jgi:DNA-binding NarL/FixJ family response regulator/Tfp pilus assembly protein PilZ
MKFEIDEFASSYGLSPREKEVMGLLAHKIVHFKDIAQHLKLSPSTVNNHFKSIFGKTSTKSKSELLGTFLRHVMTKLDHYKPLARKPQVLVIDDEPGIRDFLVEELTLRGMKVYGFTDPAEAISSLASIKLDVIVSDLRMPEIGGIDLLKEVRKYRHYFPSIVFVSGYANQETLDRVMHLGAVDLLEKPIDMNKLFNLIMEQFIDGELERTRYFSKLVDQTPTSLTNELALETRSIGFGGVFLPFSKVGKPSQFTLGNLVSFRFKLNDAAESAPIDVTGEVVWTRPTTKDQLLSGAGVKFVQISEDDRAKIHDYVRVHKILSFIPMGQA